MGTWDVVVVGSANLDRVLRVDALPAPGETVLAVGREEGPGGKGLNQAVAAARSGARTALVAALGQDDAAAALRRELRAAQVDDALVRTSGLPTGTAFVTVDRAGENAIVVDPGANAGLRDLAAGELAAVGAAGVVLCQLEVPVETVVQALAAAPGLAVLNAAPAQPLAPELLAVLDVLVVNEHEARAVSGRPDAADALDVLLAQVPEVVVTLGAAGAVVADRSGRRARVPAVPARTVVDTTGAGDVFCGAYAAARARGQDGVSAARTACGAASLSVEREGASRSAPTADEVRERAREVAGVTDAATGDVSP